MLRGRLFFLSSRLHFGSLLFLLFMKNYSGKRVFLLTSVKQGGAETYLLRFLQKNSTNDTVFCKSGGFGNLFDDFQKANVDLVAWRLGYVSLLGYFKFYRFLKREKIKTICDFTGNFAGIPLLLAKFAGVKIRIAQYRGAEDHFKQTLLRRIYNYLVKQLTFRCATKIVSNSKAALDYFYPGIWRGNPKFQVIYNGVDIQKLLEAKSDRAVLRKEFGIPANAFVIGHTGRYNRAKNHDTIIEVAVRLCKKYPDIYFFLAGLNVDVAYAERVKQEGLEDRIIMPGYRDDVPRLLYLMNVFYFPSVTEGQPNSLLEAEIVGLPIVASDIAPMKEAVPEPFVEKLIPSCDVDCAVNTLEKLYRSEELRKEYICQEWAMENFDGNARFDEFRKALECN